MSEYQSVIEETVVDDFTVEADSLEEAQSMAEQLYRDGKIVLESG